MTDRPGGLPPITSKAMLEQYLREAAVLEQQFMCQYLYAAFSLKKDPDAGCGDAEFEYVRRWASTIYKVARQEMEHLSVVNSILTAIGGQPYFGHLGTFPTQSRWYATAARARDPERAAAEPAPCDIPFRLERFTLATARRYACMEAPALAWVVPGDRDDLLRWCFQDADGRCGLIEGGEADAGGAGAAARRTPAPPRPLAATTEVGAPPADVELGTVQELYDAIDAGLRRLDAELGSAALFSGHGSGQSEIPSEYDIYLFPICDLASALAGTKMIKTQGEGIAQAPGAESHYQLFVDIAREYEALLAANPGFEPSRSLPPDPRPDQYADRATLLASEAFHIGYATLLAMLTGYYARWTRTAWQASPHLLPMLQQAAFAPMMTMLVHSLAEVVTLLPADDGGPAGVSFDLYPGELELLADPANPLYDDILFYAVPLDMITKILADVLAEPVPDEVRPRLAFIVENVTRIVRNLIYNYQHGIYPRFDPDNPAINCAPAPGCDGA